MKPNREASRPLEVPVTALLLKRFCHTTASGVYLAQFFRVIDKNKNADIYEQAVKSPYYIGAVHENEVENGKKLVQILIDKKCRNIGLIGWEQGDATWLGRWEGYKAGVEEWNAAHPSDQVKLSDPQYAGTSSEGGTRLPRLWRGWRRERWCLQRNCRTIPSASCLH